VRDFFKDEDIKQQDDGNFWFWDKTNNALWYDDINDTGLGDKYVYSGLVNEVTASDGYYKSAISSIWAPNDNSIHASAGFYTDQRLFLNDDRNPGLLYMSDIGQPLSISASLAMTIDTMGLDNPIKGIAHAGLNTFVFGDSSIVMLRPTGSATQPYIPTIISTHVGLVANCSLTVLDNVIYFIGNDHRLWTCNMMGQLAEVGGSYNDAFETATDSVILDTDPRGIAVRMMFRGPVASNNLNGLISPCEDYIYRCISFYPRRQFSQEEIGYRDSFTYAGTTDNQTHTPSLKLAPMVDEYVLTNYQYIHGAELEFGFTKYGEIVWRDPEGEVYQDTSLVDQKTLFSNAIYRGPVMTTYPVPLELERPVYFANKTKLNAIILYGTGNWQFSFVCDSQPETTPRTYAINPLGTQIPVGYLGRLFKIHILNIDPSDATITKIGLMHTAEGGTNIQNVTSAGKAV
jgi:hypothetical protein